MTPAQAPAFDDVDAKLLGAIQQQIPLVERPFAALGEALGVDEATALNRVIALKTGARRVIRQISAIFDSGTLGYQSSLVAAKIDPRRLEEAAEIINRHPGVSHNYQRQHDYNLWYTIAVPPDSALGLQRTVDLLHQQSGALATRLLPTLKLYKIGVKFNVSGEGDVSARTESSSSAAREKSDFVVTEHDKRMILVLQQDLPLQPRPYDLWAEQAGASVAQLLSAAQSYIDRGAMRRFSAVLRHREAGFTANAMGVWPVPVEKHDEFGRTAASFEAVSHCYLRPTYPDWPYSVFTMVHAPTPAECEKVLASISQATGITGWGALYSTREFKKIRVKYFTPDIPEWEKRAAGA